MNKIVTSEKEILDICKNIVVEEGLQAVSMRAVAKRCNVAVGSIYNYYDSKDDLIISTIKSIWTEIINEVDFNYETNDFIEYLSKLFNQIHYGCKKYPNFFTIHALSFTKSSKEKGRQAMDDYFDRIKENMLKSIKNDSNVKKEVFTNDFKEDEFIEFIFSNFIGILADSSKSITFLLELIKKIIY